MPLFAHIQPEFYFIATAVAAGVSAIAFFFPVTVFTVLGFLTSMLGVAMVLVLPEMLKIEPEKYFVVGTIVGAYSAVMGVWIIWSGLFLVALGGGIASIRRRLPRSDHMSNY